ncbi:type IV pilin protein [Desulfosoma sp.]|uniref:type IV pilin protein n=2 Tax=Desulfosoma sp. TaxID=2603217 RepID=UPI004049E712
MARMVTTAIVAVLAAVGGPAYVYSVRSSEPAKAVKALMRAPTEKEAFWGDHYWYAATLEFPPFKDRSRGKSNLSLQTPSDGHRERIDAAQMNFGRKLHISDNACTPVVDTPKALG